MIVIDASTTLAWILPDEDEARAEALLRLVETRGALVPPVWSLEVGNALAVAERRRRLTKCGVETAVDLLRRLPIRAAELPAESAFGQVLALARRHGLSTYDASYLELSLRVACPLASLDRKLIAAARRAKVAVLPDPLR